MKRGDQVRRFATTEGAREQGSKGAREQGSGGAREQGSEGAGERGSRKADKFFSLAHSLTRSLALLRDGGAGGLPCGDAFRGGYQGRQRLGQRFCRTSRNFGAR